MEEWQVLSSLVSRRVRPHLHTCSPARRREEEEEERFDVCGEEEKKNVRQKNENLEIENGYFAPSPLFIFYINIVLIQKLQYLDPGSHFGLFPAQRW